MLQKFKKEFKQWLKDFGWSDVILISLLFGFLFYGIIERVKLNSNPAYVPGELIATRKGARGSWYWEFIFYANGYRFESSAPMSNCKKCSVGDTVLIMYEIGNPYNNQLSKDLSVDSFFKKKENNLHALPGLRD